ncbi:MAG: dienelactone hydrolase family protein [Burkholderiales bacterium]
MNFYTTTATWLQSAVFVALAVATTVPLAQEITAFQPNGMEQLEFQTISCTGFINTPSHKCVPITLRGYLARAKDQRALVVISHGSQGLDQRHSDYARHLAAQGINGLVLDHWAARGLTDVFHDYNAGRDRGGDVPNMTVDTLMVLAALKETPDWSDTKFGFMGESMGGGAAIGLTRPYLRKLATTTIGHQPPLLQAIVSLYPGCFDKISVERFMPMPLLFVLAEKDDNTPAQLCEQYSDWMNSRGGTTEWRVLPGQYHDFDAPFRSHVSHTAENPSKCANYADDSGFTLDATGKKFPRTAEGYKAMHTACVKLSWFGVTGGNKGDPHTGYDVWTTYFLEHLK